LKPRSLLKILLREGLSSKLPTLQPLRTLATYRRSERGTIFGRNLMHDTLGTVHVGDAIEVTPL
jgi:uncharacterized protein YcbX